MIRVQAVHTEGVGTGIFAADGLTENAISIVRASGAPTAALFRAVIGDAGVVAGDFKGGQKVPQQRGGITFVDTPDLARAALRINIPACEAVGLQHLCGGQAGHTRGASATRANSAGLAAGFGVPVGIDNITVQLTY